MALDVDDPEESGKGAQQHISLLLASMVRMILKIVFHQGDCKILDGWRSAFSPAELTAY